LNNIFKHFRLLSLQADGIDKELVFKLQYKTHVYFFRAENEYTFFRYE